MVRVRVDPKTQSRGVMIVNDQTTGRGEGTQNLNYHELSLTQNDDGSDVCVEIYNCTNVLRGQHATIHSIKVSEKRQLIGLRGAPSPIQETKKRGSLTQGPLKRS